MHSSVSVIFIHNKTKCVNLFTVKHTESNGIKAINFDLYFVVGANKH